jgi:hypothetical protein
MLSMVLALGAVLVLGCGAGSSDDDGIVMEEIGRIEVGDTADPNHSGLLYDGYVFSANALDSVAVVVRSEGFLPLTKLVEVETGAVLAEWDYEYSQEEFLTYIIAAPGEYEARVYSVNSGTGDYKLTITVMH